MNGYTVKTDRDGRGWVCVFSDEPSRIQFGPATLFECIHWRALAIDLSGVGHDRG